MVAPLETLEEQERASENVKPVVEEGDKVEISLSVGDKVGPSLWEPSPQQPPAPATPPAAPSLAANVHVDLGVSYGHLQHDSGIVDKPQPMKMNIIDEDRLWALHEDLDSQRSEVLKSTASSSRGSPGVRPWLGHLALLFRWNGTTAPMVLTSPTFIGGIIIWLTATIAHLKSEDGLPLIDQNTITPIGTGLTFLTVFYLNQNLDRWKSQWDASMSCQGRIVNVATTLRACMDGTTGAKYSTKITHYLSAAHALAYCGLSNADDYDEQFFLLFVKRFCLLSPKETQTVLNMMQPTTGPAAFHEVIRWALQSILVQQRRGFLTDNQADQVTKEVTTLRGLLATQYDYDCQPFPFAYYNLMQWMLHLYTPAAAYHFATSYADTWYFSWIPVFFFNGVLIALVLMSEEIAKPFGSDVMDFSVFDFINCTCRLSERVLSSWQNPFLEEDGEEKGEPQFPPSELYAWDGRVVGDIEGLPLCMTSEGEGEKV